jgi:hypothetical protein
MTVPLGTYASGFPDDLAFEELLARLDWLSVQHDHLVAGEHVSEPAADDYRSRVEKTQRFGGHVHGPIGPPHAKTRSRLRRHHRPTAWPQPTRRSSRRLGPSIPCSPSSTSPPAASHMKLAPTARPTLPSSFRTKAFKAWRARTDSSTSGSPRQRGPVKSRQPMCDRIAPGNNTFHGDDRAAAPRLRRHCHP